ncbi:hypothetical protein [Aureimonas altamirensis]|uniref:hypothetical protein n=1 Tax=Aureimonas altamirensis TaxID=370622 RepID=UPI00301B4226
MSRTTNVGENPNDKMPDGNPLKPGEVVTDDDASSAEMEREVEEDLDEMDEDGDAEDIDDVGAEGLRLPSDDGRPGHPDEEDEQPGLA